MEEEGALDFNACVQLRATLKLLPQSRTPLCTWHPYCTPRKTHPAESWLRRFKLFHRQNSSLSQLSLKQLLHIVPFRDMTIFWTLDNDRYFFLVIITGESLVGMKSRHPKHAICGAWLWFSWIRLAYGEKVAVNIHT